MKKYLVLLSVVLISYAVKAQFTFGLDGGLSIPGRDYGSSNQGATSSGGAINGYAKIGSCYDAFAGFKFIPLIGVMAEYGVNNNAYDVAKLNTSGGNSTFSSTGGDKISSYLIGPFFSIKLANIKLEAKLLGGIVSSSYPTITQSSSFNGISGTVANSFSNGNNFGYCAGAKIKFMAARIVGIALGLDYLASDASFKGVSTTSYNSQTIDNNYNMSVGVFQVTLGASLDF